MRVGGFGATCGQCDLDAAGRPLHAGELWPQVETVTAHLLRRLEQVGARPDEVRRLEAFYVGPADEPRLRGVLRDATNPDVDVLLVPLPYFYYPGMRIELDAMFDRSGRFVFQSADDLEQVPAGGVLARRVYYRAGSPPPSRRRWRCGPRGWPRRRPAAPTS